MSAYRNEVEALRRRLELETKRADDAEAGLRTVRRGREHTWVGDIQIFLARCALMLVPIGLLTLLTFYFGAGAVFGIFDDSRPLAFLFTIFVLPLCVVSPLAAYKLDGPSRAGWALALFSFLYTCFVVPPIGMWGLYAILRGRVRDAVFGESEGHDRVRVELPDVTTVDDEGELAVAERELSRTNRSVGSAE